MEIPDSARQSEEAQLVARLRQGDKAALEQLYIRYVDRVYSLVFQQVGRNKSVAEDIVTEIFIAALDSVNKFRGQSKFYTWLCSIAYHKIADFYRRQRREAKQGKEPVSTAARELEQMLDIESLAPSLIEFEETRHIVEQALFKLPFDYRQVLVLKYVEEMPVLEIGQIMRRSPKAVEGRLTRARKALRSGLAEQDEGCGVTRSD